jgi:hypothetical protein
MKSLELRCAAPTWRTLTSAGDFRLSRCAQSPLPIKTITSSTHRSALNIRAVFAAVFLLIGASGTARAQSYIWGGAGSTTTTTNYNLGTNWANPPAGAPPVAGGQAAVFGSTGNATVVTASPIAPDSWTFNVAPLSQSYTVSGAAVNFGLPGATGGIISNVAIPYSISISNNIGEVSAGVQVQQLGDGILTLSGTNTYTGATTVNNGFLVLQGSITSNVIVSGLGTFNNSGTVTGAVNTTLNSQTVINNSGTIAGLLTIDGGHVFNTNTGHLNGGVTLTGGNLTTTGTVAGGIINDGAGIFASGSINGAIANNTGLFEVTGVLSGNSTFTNTVVAGFSSTLILDAFASYTAAGLVTNSGTITVANGATVTATAGLTNIAGTITDAGTIAGTVNVNGGTLTGNGTVANLTVGSGGTFAPGNGTAGTSMTVTGNLAFASGALYLVQINPATASFANVTGAATLGGATVNAIYANGSYVAKQYTILSAAGGVSGAFNSLINTNLPSAFQASWAMTGTTPI